MLPTTGHFKDIECPYYEDACDRPYCHFRHRRKNAETPEHTTEVPEEDAVQNVEVPTYKPTPKSQLAANTRSHIPISYVPDLAAPSARRFVDRQIVYKPTPISVLSTSTRAGCSLSNEQNNDKETKSHNTSTSNPMSISSNEYNPEMSLRNDNFNFEELSMEFDMIDDIISDCDVAQEGSISGSDSIKNGQDATKEPDSSDSKMKQNKDVKNSKEKKDSKVSVKDKSKSEHKKRDKKGKEKSKHEHKSSSSSSSKHEKRDKSKSKTDDKKESKSDRHSKHKRKDKSRDREKKKDKDGEKNKEQSKNKKEKSKNKEKVKTDNEMKKKTENEQTVKSECRKNKESDSINFKMSDKTLCETEKLIEIHVDNEESMKSFSDDDNIFMDYDDLEEDNTLEECYRIFNEYKAEETKPVEMPEQNIVTENVNPTGKKRIAHSSAENIVVTKQYTKPKEVVNPAQMMSNRFKLARAAQANNEQNNLLNELKRQPVKRPPTCLLTVSNIKIKRVQSSTKNIANSASVIDEILTGNTKPASAYSILNNKPVVRKIAPVQNVSMMQRAKAKIEEIAKQKAVDILNKTVSQTVSKGNKRVAHVPEFSLSDIPDVLHADKSKLPVNVRTRYLTMLADGCFKLYITKEDAYQRALDVEFKCYERCKTLSTYRNSVMLSVNRIRKEVQEREKLDLGPTSLAESCGGGKSIEFRGPRFYDNIKSYVLTEEELDLHGYPRESSIPGKALIQIPKKPRRNLQENERVCARCNTIYFVDEDGFPVHDEECVYHPLKKRTLRGERTYLCCKSTDDLGCATSNTHVCDTDPEIERDGYQTTMEPENETDPRNYAVYALDCEMCYTTKGLELTRVTIVDVDLKTVYESLVKPLNPIIDYNTRFSGITKDQMDKTSTSILQVQANILHLCNSKTILIGHSLESDMKALKIIHSTIIDTAVVFPHKFGLPHKRALRALASEYLKKIIQNDVSGHDSAEDALTCMELIIWKVKEDLKLKGMK